MARTRLTWFYDFDSELDQIDIGKTFMAIWRGSDAMPSVGPQVHLKFKLLGGGQDYADSASEAIGLARIMMRYILTKLNKGAMALTVNQLQVLDYYFVLGGNPPAPGDIGIIRQTLQLTSNGLFSNDLNVKVKTGGGGTVGYANMHDSRFGLMDKIRTKTGAKSRWTPGYDIEAGNRKTHFGDIHLSDSAMDRGPEYAAMTLIHEATHKFASTGDYAYTSAATNFLYVAPLPTHAEALNNADSYSCCVMMAYLFP